ncbi:CYTH domain-containing protein [Sinorhizobium medicae]|uniref:CYTH domain-containing protein n=1 Tax=Sinorhizobium medicae TaxID=110321 RepID=UPI0009B73202|nr:CYTH domain-containing protein [Sinorhizobium medicae]MBO1960712.1 CYTH domain-containing protein [Sinorhizobium medicae]MDX0772567.1 CYTH domain-containing protein [Sinorhizobium medicae]MDX0907000.1 CYTH domain-containing protein [Sinorhizobium medicae]MDX1164955.1 CYTH domain-containing protein [Sinorhizobium medicae]WQO54074.1 CYTH domain-containing protein [Sinorhizobium medicae]
MALEIERKFKVLDGRWRKDASVGSELRQAYIMTTKNRTLRVRTIDAKRATLTAKFRKDRIRREEYEYEIPYGDAVEMFKFALGMVEKTRYEVRYANHLWQIDVYSGANCGLVVAEVELRNCNDRPRLPEWLGPEITGSTVYSNQVLAMGVQPKKAHPKIERGAEERTSIDTRI